MFVFEDLVNLEDKALQLAIRQVEMADLCMALKGASDEIKPEKDEDSAEAAPTESAGEETAAESSR